MEPNIQPAFTFPTRQNKANLALGLDSVINTQLITSKPSTPLNINLESAFYRADVLPPPNELEVLDVKTVLPIAPPWYVQPSIAQGLTAVAEDDAAATQITTLLSANNALRRGNYKAAEYLLKRPLSTEEIQNRSVNPETRQNNAGAPFAVGPRAGAPDSIRGAAFASQEQKFYRMDAQFRSRAAELGFEKPYIDAAVERYRATAPSNNLTPDQRSGTLWDQAIAAIEQEMKNLQIAGNDQMKNKSTMSQGASESLGRRQADAQMTAQQRRAKAREEKENPLGLPPLLSKQHGHFLFQTISNSLQSGELNADTIQQLPKEVLDAIYQYGNRYDLSANALALAEYRRRKDAGPESMTDQIPRPALPVVDSFREAMDFETEKMKEIREFNEELERQEREAEEFKNYPDRPPMDQRSNVSGQNKRQRSEYADSQIPPNKYPALDDNKSNASGPPGPVSNMSDTGPNVGGATSGTVTAPLNMLLTSGHNGVATLPDIAGTQNVNQSLMEWQRPPFNPPIRDPVRFDQPNPLVRPDPQQNLHELATQIGLRGQDEKEQKYYGTSDNNLGAVPHVDLAAVPTQQNVYGRNEDLDAQSILSAPAGSARVRDWTKIDQLPELDHDAQKVERDMFSLELARIEHRLAETRANLGESRRVLGRNPDIGEWQKRAGWEQEVKDLEDRESRVRLTLHNLARQHLNRLSNRQVPTMSTSTSSKKTSRSEKGGDLGGGAIRMPKQAARRQRLDTKSRTAGVIRVAGPGPNVVGIDGFYGNHAPVTSHLMAQNTRDSIPISGQVQVNENHQFTEASVRQFIKHPQVVEDVVAEFEPIAINTSQRVQRPKASSVFDRGHYGKFLINHIALEGKRTLSLSYKGGKKIRGLPNKKLSNNEYNAVKKVLGGGLITAGDKMTKAERTWLAEVHRRAGIPMHPGLMMKTLAGKGVGGPSRTLVPGDHISSFQRGSGALANVDPRHQIMDILGEMDAGNDNPALKTQLHRIADMLLHKKQITPALYAECKQHWS